jgi:hypothetical protein
VKTLLIILLVLLPAAAMAQKRASKHTCRILFFDAPPDAPKTLYLFDGKASQEIELPKMNFSPVYELPAGPLNLRLLPEPPVDPKKIPADAPSGQVTEKVLDFYLLVTSDPENKVAPVRMQVIDAGSDKLKLGQMLWFNLTPNTIGGVVGTQRLLVKPNCRQVTGAPAPAAGEYPIQLFFQIPHDEHVYPLCSTSWGHDPRSRNIIFIHPDPGSRTPRVRGFTDFREPVMDSGAVVVKQPLVP